MKMAERIIQGIVQKNIPPIVPPRGKRRRGNASGQTSPRRLRTGSRNASPPSGRWAAYPCGKSKQAAIRAWDKLKPDDALIREMALGLKRAMQSEEWQRGIGIPYASTWLNNRRWKDEDKSRPSAGEPSAPKLVAREEVPTW